MKRFLTIAVLGLAALGASSMAYANVCSVDNVPAASLVFPYVVYDYEGGFQGDTTLFTITNTSSDAQIVHITVWTDWSQPVLDYNVVLTGYDVYRQNIRDILRDGILPGPLTGDTIWASESDLNDLGDGVSEEQNLTGPWNPSGIGAGLPPVPLGPFSPFNEVQAATVPALDAPEATWDGVNQGNPLNANVWDLNCNPDWQNGGWLGSPNNYTFPIDNDSLDFFESLLKASQTASDRGFWCNTITNDVTDEVLAADSSIWWLDRTSGPVQFYITADVIGNCNKLFPDSPIFWQPYEEGADSAVGVAKYDNVLIGDLIYLNTEGRFSEAYNAIHLEAVDPREADLGSIQTTIPNTGAGPDPSQVSFYHRYTLENNAGVLEQVDSDGREPMPTAWAFRYQVSDATGVDTFVRVFKKASLMLPEVNVATPDLVPADFVGSIPDDFLASTCQPYTYYSWDEDENVAGAPGGGFQPPWSGTPAEPAPIPNVAPFETQEFPVRELSVVENADGDAFGWMLFVWPPSNGSDGNLSAFAGLTPPQPASTTPEVYQTWMGVKYGGFGLFTAAMEGAVMGHFGCDATQVLPDLGWGLYENMNGMVK